MKDIDRRSLGLSAALAAVAGFVDAVGFLDSGGLFVSFMSGNSTQGAVALVTESPVIALVSAGIIAAFVAGVTAGALVSARASRPQTWVVAGAAVTVALTAVIALGGSQTLWRVALLAAAMGALNTLFIADGRARVAITYSTGTLVTLGLALGALLARRSPAAWQRPLLLWSSLAAGAVVGGVTHRLGSPIALGIAAAALLALAGVIASTTRSRSAPPAEG